MQQSFDFSSSPSNSNQQTMSSISILPTKSASTENLNDLCASLSMSLESDKGQDGLDNDVNSLNPESMEKTRRYSWELNSNDLAENPNQPENMAKSLIKFYLSSKKLKLYTPKLSEYKEILRTDEYSAFTQKFIANYAVSSERNQVFHSKSMSSTLSRIIGDENWAPVREQLILNANEKQKTIKTETIMRQQDYRCADCGYRLMTEPSNFTKMFRYCEYYGKYFCRCCHVNSTSYIPSYVIFKMDFKQTYYVCKKAKHFLDKIFYEPLITLEDLNPAAFKKNDLLFQVKKTRLKLYNCQKYINSCRFAYQLKDFLEKHFEYYLVSDTRVYSFDVLFKFKKTDYDEQLGDILNKIIDHILKCELCSQKAFICELCNKKNELLYPFNIDHVCKCPNCLNCYHIKCFKSPELCPKCIRKRSRTSHDANIALVQ
jgi:run domain Beclin-1 interacting cysteine-rich containing protein